ncbi:MAG: hypothetical protein ABSH48_07145 [Verrucomicrobiota bacterium]
MKNIWRSGIIFTAANFLTLLIGFGFQVAIRRQLQGQTGEFGFVQAAIAFIGFLGLPLAVATQAVTHYIARFHFGNENSRLHGLLEGCRKFLLHITIVGSVAAIVLVGPLGAFFHIPRASLTFIALICVLAGFWSSFITALCQGLGWFKRLALIGLLAAVLRFAFGVSATRLSPTAEWAVLASAVMLLSNLILLFWKKEFPRKTEVAVSPWSAEMVQFLLVSAACAIGSSCFGQYDVLVAQRYFPGATLDDYAAAGLLARQIPTLVGPLLTVLFTHRSSRDQHRHNELREQMKLLGLYTLGLIVNATGLFLLKSVGLRLLGQNTPAAASMIAPLAMTMVFIGLLQAIGTWALASRWIKISLLYGALGLAYWLTLLLVGKTSTVLLHVMPLAAGAALAVLFTVWFAAMRLHKISVPAPD